MSWQSQWGTVKATNARAAALYFEVSNVGKTIESSKKRVIWRLKVEEGRDFEISLTHSLASGKKVLRVDGIVKYTSRSLSFGDWDYVFNLVGGHCVHIIIKPSVDLNDMYDLIVDGISFRRLPNRLDPAKLQKAQDHVVTSATRTTGGPSALSYNYSNGGNSYSKGGSRNSSRESSFSPWECTRCTLVNEKGQASLCEACGHPKPDQISTESRQRAKMVASTPPPSHLSGAKSAVESPIDFDAWSNAPSASATSSAAFPALTDADGFLMTMTTPSLAPKQQDITSMLSGLDFTPAPVAETSSPVETRAEPTEKKEESTTPEDLWSSGMVDLNLKPEDKNSVKKSAKHYQTMEQARQLAPKEKIQVLPTPPPTIFPASNIVQAPGAFYGGIPPMQPMMYNMVGNADAFGMMPAPMGFGGPQTTPMAPYEGFHGQQTSLYMTTAPMNALPKQSSMQNMGNNPFATLS